MSRAEKVRVPALTGLRFTAAVIVFFRHTGLPRPFDTFWLSGTAGVTLFFALSGFVLALRYFDEMTQPTPRKLWGFAVARIARIYPLYLAVLIYTFIHFRWMGIPLDGWSSHVFAVQAWESDALEAMNFNGPNWSISVEFFLYACFPIIVPLVAWARKPRTIASLMAVVLAGLTALTVWFIVWGKTDPSSNYPVSAYRWLYWSPPSRLFDFTLGILAARLFLAVRHRPAAVKVGGPMAVVGAIVFVVVMCQRRLVDTPAWFDLAFVVPGLAIIFGLAVAPASVAARMLSRRTMLLLGEASFALSRPGPRRRGSGRRGLTPSAPPV